MCKVRLLSLLTVVSVPLSGQTAQYFVARSASGAAPSIRTFETFLINSEDTVRTLAEPASAVDGRTYSRLPKVRLATIGVLRRDGKNVYQIAADGKRTLVLPDGARIQSPVAPEDLWAKAVISAGASRREREATTIAFEEWFAAGAGGLAGAVAFVQARHNFGSLDEQLTWIRAADIGQVRGFLQQRMTSALAAFDSEGSHERLLEGLKYAAVARDDAELSKTANSLRDRRAAVESTLQKLQELFDNRKWDEFLDSYSAIERYETSFPRMVKNRRRALLESAHLHVQSGRPHTALRRDPDNKLLQDRAEEKRLETALAAAREYSASHKEPAADSPQAVRFTRHISLATRYLTDRNFAEADRELDAAAEVEKDSPRLLLLRARLLRARNDLVPALTTLNRYDERATDPAARQAGEELRVETMYSLNKQRTGNREQLRKLLADRRYAEGLAAAVKALELDARDSEFLWHAAVFSAILRDKRAERYFSDYLEVTNTLAADPARRRTALRIRSITASPAPPAGCKLPPNVFYCPQTLEFQPRIASVRAKDVTQTFEWRNDGKLTAIRRPDGMSFTFAYSPESGVLTDAGLEKPGAPPVNTSVISDSAVNTQVIGLLQGREPANGVAGNPYFNPFVWTGLHTFEFSYDKNGRVERAAESGATRVTRFTWDGDRLQSLAVYADKDTDRPVYRRTLTYMGDRLVSEAVEYGGRQYRITYKHAGDRLTEAEFDDNGAHDGLSRNVRFQ